MFLTFFVLHTSCKDELITVEGWKDIPVVYAVLSTKDTATYIRVEKAFSDPTKNAIDVAQIADSLYYADAIVSLVNDKTNERFNLTQVDGNTEGYPRKDGVFAKAPNKMYKIKTAKLAMKADEKWRIEVARQSKMIVKETVAVVGEYALAAPINKTLFFRNDGQFSISIQTDEEEQTGRTYEANVILNIDETLNGATKANNLVWKFRTQDTRGKLGTKFDPTVDFQNLAKEFYIFLNLNVPVVAGMSRTIKSIDLEVLIGGQEFIDYRARFNSNSGITGSQTILNYANKGGSLGFISSRSRVLGTDFKLSNETLENLKNNELTKNLGFK